MLRISENPFNHYLLALNDPPLPEKYKMTINVAISDSVSFPPSVYYLDSKTEGFSLPEEVVDYLSKNNEHYEYLLTHFKDTNIVVEDAYPGTECRNIMQFNILLTYDINVIAKNRTEALGKAAMVYKRSEVCQNVDAIKTLNNQVDIWARFVNDQPNQIFLSELIH